MKVKLTDTALRSYEARPKAYAIGDAACPGLCVRITPKGVKSFAFAYRSRVARKVEWLTLGRYPDLPLTRARELANDARKTVANGAWSAQIAQLAADHAAHHARPRRRHQDQAQGRRGDCSITIVISRRRSNLFQRA